MGTQFSEKADVTGETGTMMPRGQGRALPRRLSPLCSGDFLVEMHWPEKWGLGIEVDIRGDPGQLLSWKECDCGACDLASLSLTPISKVCEMWLSLASPTCACK